MREIQNSNPALLFKDLENEVKNIDSSKPFERIWDLLVKQNVNKIKIENDYYCKDFKSEFSVFYSKLFKKIDPKCERLHFWSENEYLGFCVLRPINYKGSKGQRLGRVGRTMIKYKPLDDEYLLSVAKYKANIQGDNLSVMATPFLQQDTQLGACAQAVIWMAARYLHGKYRFREYYMDEITEMATRYRALGQIVPSLGLYEEQFIEAIRLMGYSPLIYSPTDMPGNSFFPDSMIYRYLESGIPVLLSTKAKESKESHALMAIGHNFNFNKAVIEAKGGYYTPLSWIDYFIVHDDARGPYLPMYIRDDGNKKSHYFVYSDIESIFIPLPIGINLRGEDAEQKSFNLIVNNEKIKNEINLLLNENQLKTNQALQIFKKAMDEKKIVLRTYLKPSNDYKLYLDKNGPISKLRAIYRLLSMPKYIWVVEISTLELFAQEKDENRKMLGEIIFDATDSPYSESFLIIHLPCLCIIRNADTEKWSISSGIEYADLKEDTIYSHCINKNW